MGIVFRQSIKTSIVTFLGALLGAIILYLSITFLPQKEFGFARNLLSQAIVGSQFILMGMHSMLYVFISKYPSEHKGRSVVITIGMATPLLLTLLFGIIYIIAKPYIIPLYNANDILLVERYFYWLPLYVLLWGLLIILEQFLNTQMKIAATSFLREVVLRLLNIGLIIAFGFEYIDFNYFIILSVLVHLLPVAALWLMARKVDGFSISTNWKALTKLEYKKIFDFAFFHLLLNMSVVLLDNIDILMIPILDVAGMTSAGIYFIAVYVVSIYQIPYRALATSTAPILNIEYQNNNMDKVRDLFSRSSINIWIATFGMGILIIANLNNGFAVLPDKYAAAYSVVLILMLGRSINMLTGLNNEMISISNYYRFNFYFTSVLIILIVSLNFLLIPKYGINGAAWGTTIAIGLYNLMKMLFLWIKFKLSPFTKGSIPVLLSAIVAITPGLLMPLIYNPIIDTFVRSLIVIILYLAMLYWLKPSQDFNQYMKNLLKNKKLF
ncbi:MAG: polysaccharide biosynthesis C-terminal domain-containing protein [Flavipsychrobacter sp.]